MSEISKAPASRYEKPYEQIRKNYPQDILPGLEMLRAEYALKNFPEINENQLRTWKETPINPTVRLNPKTYRDQYFNHPVEEKEPKEPLAPISTYGLKSEDVYYQYSQRSRDELMKILKVDDLIRPSGAEKVINPSDMIPLEFDTFFTLTSNQQEEVIRKNLKTLGLEIRDGIRLDEKNRERLRMYISLHYGNIRLKPVVRKNGDILLRSSVGARIGEINNKLKDTGYSIGIETGYRSAEVQEIAKENRKQTHGEADANKRFADKGKSDHQTGGAVDIILLDKNGKKINLNLFEQVTNANGTKETVSLIGLLDGENLIQEKGWEKLTPQEKQAIEGRRLVFHIMKSAGFTELETEHWHYGLGARLPALVESIQEKKIIPARYGLLDTREQ